MSLSNIIASEDHFVDSAQPTTHMTETEKIHVKKRDYDALVKFSLSSLPEGACISAATLYLYCDEQRGTDVAKIYETTDGWDEDTVTWNLAPAAGTYKGLFSTGTGWKSLSVTSYVQAQWSGDEVVSFRLKPEATGADWDGQRFYSKEQASNKPYLAITYTQPPAAPSGCAAQYVATNLSKCTWQDNSDNETNFRLEVDINDAGFAFWKNVGANVEDSGNHTTGANKKIRFRVRAYNACGYSTWSTSGYVYTTPSPSTGATTVYVATDNAKLTWSDQSAYEEGFKLQKAIGAAGWTDWKTVGPNVQDSGNYDPGANTRIKFRVCAYKGALYSTYSEGSYVYTTPTAPSGISLSWLIQDETVRITWTDNSAYEQDFDIEKATDGGGYGHLVYDAASPYDDAAPSGLNHRYIYRVRARCPDGRLSGWNTASKYMYSTPSIPTALSLSWLSQDETIRLTYTKNHPYGDIDIYKETDDGGFGHLAYDVASPYDDTTPSGLDHKYEYKIRARTSQSDDGTYEYSSFTSIQTIYSTPNAPSGCSIALGTINVTWTDNSAYEEGFQVERQLDGGGWGLVHTTAAEAEAWGDTSQPTGANIKYEYRVRAKIGSLYSTYSTSNASFIKTCSESIALSDAYSRVWTIYRTFTESINLSDAYSRVCNWFRTFIESITLADTLQKKPAKTFIESLSLTDTLQKKPAKIFTESITLTDIYSRVWNIYRTFTETLSLADTLMKKSIKTFIESLHLADTLIKRPAKIFTETISLADTLKKRAHRIFTETLSLTDTVSKKAVKTFLETLHLEDRYTRVVSWYKVFTEKITLTDTVKKVKSNLVQLWKKLMNLFDIEG